MAERKPFVSIRPDGVGEWLQAVINAISLARLCDAPFAFTWPVPEDYRRNSHVHAIRDPHETFDSGYARTHVLPDDACGFERLGAGQPTVAELKDRLAAAAAGLAVDQGYQKTYVEADNGLLNTVQRNAIWSVD